MANLGNVRSLFNKKMPIFSNLFNIKMPIFVQIIEMVNTVWVNADHITKLRSPIGITRHCLVFNLADIE